MIAMRFVSAEEAAQFKVVFNKFLASAKAESTDNNLDETNSSGYSSIVQQTPDIYPKLTSAQKRKWRPVMTILAISTNTNIHLQMVCICILTNSATSLIICICTARFVQMKICTYRKSGCDERRDGGRAVERLLLRDTVVKLLSGL